MPSELKSGIHNSITQFTLDFLVVAEYLCRSSILLIKRHLRKDNSPQMGKERGKRIDFVHYVI